MINAHNLCLTFGTQKLFDDLSFTIQHDQRIGLVGLNGSGKSTLLKVISGRQPIDDGTLSVAKNKKLAYLPQEVVLTSDKSVFDETLCTFADMYRIEQELHTLEPLIQNDQADEDTVDRYAQLHEDLAELEPDRARAETQRILQGLGFSDEQMRKPVDVLSVGWKMRVVLAKLLLQKADFYLFDEPTNHLDIVAQEWFLQFLQRASFGFMIVCHERRFLDKVCNKILELERGTGTFYTGNYSTYEIQKEERLAQLEAAYAQQQKDIKQKRATINRFRASASKAKMAQSMMKQLEKIEKIELPPSAKNITFTFPVTQRAGRVVLTVKNVAQAFGDKQIFNNVSFQVERGEKVAIIAPNGVGKTTLFNIIAGKYPLQTGLVEWGYNTHHALFDQDQTKSLNPDDTILQAVEKACGDHLSNKIRNFLGAFLFSNDDVEKKTKVLSGGEKNRVGMIRVLLKGANVLLLDEPTNHLDIPSKDILLKALQSYNGTIIFVSHDQDFVNKLATRILDLSSDGITSYHGNYDEYLYQKREAKKLVGKKVGSIAPGIPKNSNKKNYTLQKESKKLEKKIERCEQDIAQIENGFDGLTYGTQEFSAVQEKLSKAKLKLKDLLAQWEALQKQIN